MKRFPPCTWAWMVGEVQFNAPNLAGGFGRCKRSLAPDDMSEVLIKFAGVGAELVHRKATYWSFCFRSSGRGDLKDAAPFIERMGEKGLLEGKRLRRCAPLSRLYWPYLYCMANGLCRLELDYDLLAERLFSFRNMAPDAAGVEQLFADYEKNHLIFIYQNKDQHWGQWDFVDPSDIKRFLTKEERRCPQPIEPDYSEWLRDQHGEDWESHNSTLVSAQNNNEFESKRDEISRKRAEAGRKGGLAKAGKLDSPAEEEEFSDNEAEAGKAWQAEANDGKSGLGIGIGSGSGLGSGSGSGVGSGYGIGEDETVALALTPPTSTPLVVQNKKRQEETKQQAIQKQSSTSTGIRLAGYLYICMEKQNPDAFANAPANWRKFWSGDMDKLLAEYTEEQLSDIIWESQVNPKFRKYVVRGQGLVDMAETIQAHLLEHGQYEPEAGDADEDDADDEDFSVNYHPDVRHLASRWKDSFHSDIDLSLVNKWYSNWGSNNLLRAFRFLSLNPDWLEAIPDAEAFDRYIAEIMDAADPDTPDCAPPLMPDEDEDEDADWDTQAHLPSERPEARSGAFSSPRGPVSRPKHPSPYNDRFSKDLFTGYTPTAPIEEDPDLATHRCVSLWKRKHPDRPWDEEDFVHLLDHFDEDDILLAIRRFPNFGNRSAEINNSGDFRDNFSEILEEGEPDEVQDSDDGEVEAF